MKKQIYMKPTVGVVSVDGEELMTVSLNANDLGIGFGGNASENEIEVADAKGFDLWTDEEE